MPSRTKLTTETRFLGLPMSVKPGIWASCSRALRGTFSFAPKDQFAALKYARQNGLKILANWHSHPASPSRPSQEDLRLANDPTIRYAILSLHEGVHLNSFKILNGEVVDKEEHF